MGRNTLIDFTFETLKMHLLFSNVVKSLTFKSKSKVPQLLLKPEVLSRVSGSFKEAISNPKLISSIQVPVSSSSPSQILKSLSHKFKSSPSLISKFMSRSDNVLGLKLKTCIWDFYCPGSNVELSSIKFKSQAQVQVQLSSLFLKPWSHKFKLNPQVQVKS